MRSVLVVLAVFLTSVVEAGTVRIALAANVSYAMPSLKVAFAKRHPDTNIQITVSGSGKLATQIRNGAPYDLFLSANIAYPQALFDAGLATQKPVVYVQGALVYLSNTPRDFSKGMHLLLSPMIHTIAVANPKTAPYGKAAFEALEKAGLLTRLRPKLVFGESIAQTVAYATHAADIGLVAKSALFAPQMQGYKRGAHWSDVDPTLYHPIDQGMILLKSSTDKTEAKAFYDFLLGKEARDIFVQFGYRVP